QRSLGIALVMAALTAPLQIYLGDLSGRSITEHQPATLAAIEAHWETNIGTGAPFALFALPDAQAEKNIFELSIPHGLSLLATHSLNGRVLGLREFPRENRPNVFLLFWTFRIMAGVGTVYLLVMIWAFFLWQTGKLYDHRPFLWTLLAIHPLGFFAIETGWITTEAGRQPWLVYNLMRTAEGTSPIPAGNIIWSLSLFLIIFAAVGSIYSFYIVKMIGRGPDVSSPIPPVQLPAGMMPLKEDQA